MDNLIGEIVGGCRIEEFIGKGGMGVVYKAHHMALDIPVALKILQPTLSLVNEIERFLREARTAARLRNPYIVGVLNVGCEKGMHYIIMEYVEGKNLLELINQKKKIPIAEAVVIAGQVLEALDAAFKQGIVHRDIKPENIIIDREGKVRLADLGLARVCGDTSLTQTAVSMGSPYYIAPEQAENPRNADHRADLYSLGCTIFHMISGAPPYSGDSFVEVILDHIRKPVPQLHKVERGVSLPLSEFVRKMMAKSPEKRYGTPSEALKALRDAMSGRSDETVETPYKSDERKLLYARFFIRVFIFIIIAASLVYVYRKGYIIKAGKYMWDLRKELSGNKSQSSQERLQFLIHNSISSSDPVHSPLHKAIQENRVEDVQLLLENGADPNAPDPQGYSPLHYALRNGDLLVVRLLIEKGANPNQRDKFGNTPLQWAKGADSAKSGIKSKESPNGTLNHEVKFLDRNR